MGLPFTTFYSACHHDHIGDLSNALNGSGLRINVTHRNFRVRSSDLHIKPCNSTSIRSSRWNFQFHWTNRTTLTHWSTMFPLIWIIIGTIHEDTRSVGHNTPPLGVPCVSCGALQRLSNCFNLFKVHIVGRTGSLGHSLGCKGTQTLQPLQNSRFIMVHPILRDTAFFWHLRKQVLLRRIEISRSKGTSNQATSKVSTVVKAPRPVGLQLVFQGWVYGGYI